MSVDLSRSCLSVPQCSGISREVVQRVAKSAHLRRCGSLFRDLSGCAAISADLPRSSSVRRDAEGSIAILLGVSQCPWICGEVGRSSAMPGDLPQSRRIYREVVPSTPLDFDFATDPGTLAEMDRLSAPGRRSGAHPGSPRSPGGPRRGARTVAGLVDSLRGGDWRGAAPVEPVTQPAK